MKRIFTIAAALFMSVSVWAQAPEKMSYQAVVRDAGNALVTSTAIGMQISILQTTATGTAVYVETHTPTSNANGLVSLEIGTGSVVSGDFSTIDWANDTFFIKTETDPTGGTNYTITGTTQLMSVPYALHAKTAETITGTVNYTEIDPVFGASIANGITAIDTANWNNHTTIDSTGVASGDILVWDGANWIPDNNQITITNDNVIMNNSFSLSDGFFLAYFANNNLSFVNDHSYIQVFPNGTPSNRIVALPNGETNGQMIVLACHWNTGANGFRLNSTGNIKLNGGGLLDLYPNDMISLIWNGQSWNELSRSDN